MNTINDKTITKHATLPKLFWIIALLMILISSVICFMPEKPKSDPVAEYEKLQQTNARNIGRFWGMIARDSVDLYEENKDKEIWK